MKRKYNLGQQSIAYVLLISLLLQSCYNLSIPSLPRPEEKLANKQIAIRGAIQEQQDPDANDLPLDKLENTPLAIQVEEPAKNPSQTIAVVRSNFPRHARLIHPISKLASIQAKQPKDSSKQQIKGQTSSLGKLKARQVLPIVRKQPGASEVSIHPWLAKTYQTKSGHAVKFYQAAGIWKANVQEKRGSLRRTLDLPVYPQELTSVTTLQSCPIHVILPEQAKDGKGYVYVGNRGLLGGGKIRKGFKQEQEPKIKDALVDVLSLGYELGEAYATGDCFFDGLAQCLNKLQATKQHTDGSLRMVCHGFYDGNKELVNEWNRKDYGGIDKGEAYYMVQYTAEQQEDLNIKGTVIWGRPHIEGRMICKELALKGICVIELLKDPESTNFITGFQLVSVEGSKSIDEKEAKALISAGQTPTLVTVQGELHFVPLLPTNTNSAYKETRQALKLYKEAAEQGHPEAQYKLGLMYEKGQEVEQDYKQAAAWYKKAAKQEHAEAQYSLGVMYAKGLEGENNYGQAVAWYKEAAEKRHPGAQYRLGEAYEKGKGAEKNYEQALKWYKKAAKQGHVDAQCNLGWMYQKGQGGEKNYEQALKWYKEAAKSHAGAQYSLGVMYEKGKGVGQDYKEALLWYTKAANQGHLEAQYNLGEMYDKGKGVERDYEQAIAWYTKVAEFHAGAKYNLAVIYGKRANKDLAEGNVLGEIKEGKKEVDESKDHADEKQFPINTNPEFKDLADKGKEGQEPEEVKDRQMPMVEGLEPDQDRIQLGATILSTTGVEPDERLNVYYKLAQELGPYLAKDGHLQGQWNSLWKKLKEPELLIDKQAYDRFSPATGSSSALEEQVFAKYTPVYEEISLFKRILQEKFPDHPEWLQKLDEVRGFYEQFRGRLCKTFADLKGFNSLIEPKALLMGEWWPGCFYRISQSQARYLLNKDEDGENMMPPRSIEVDEHPKKSDTSTSNHQISFLPEGDASKAAVYFKVNGMPALNPSREYMLYSLYKQLGIAVPASGLLVLDHVKFRENYHPEPFILQASKAIAGMSGKKVLKENHKLAIDPEHFSRQVVGALLTGPVDGKADNFILTPVGKQQGWVSIDNDEVFQAPIDRGRVHLKSVLLLLPEMYQAVSPSTKILLSCLHPSMLILSWLVDIQAQATYYERLKETLLLHGENGIYLRKGGKLLAKYVEPLWKDLRLPFINLHTSIVATVKSLLEKLQAAIKEDPAKSLWGLFAQAYPAVRAYYSHLLDLASQEQEEMESLGKSAAYGALKSLYEGKEKLNRNQDFIEEGYFREELTPAPVGIEEQIRTYLKQEANLDMGGVIKSYASWLYKTQDPLQQQWICQQALNSLQLLQAYGLAQVEDPKTAIDLYVQGLSFAQQLSQRPAWERIFEQLGQGNPELGWLLTLEKHFPRGWNHAGSQPKDLSEIRSARWGKRQLSADMQAAILDQKGGFIAETMLAGRSSTNFYPKDKPLFYFKKYPEFPAYEYAVTAFMRHLGLNAAPRSELFTFYNPQEGLYPVLLSQAITGKPVYQVWDQDNNFAKLDPYATGLLIIASMLLNPEDSKEDNFILVEDGKQLIPIDNDHAFLPGAIEVNKTIKVYHQLQTKTLAFCLEEMYKPLPRALVQQLTSLSADLFLNRWITELIGINEVYQHVLPKEELGGLWEKQGTCLRLPLSNLYTQGLYRKFHLLRILLLQDPQLTPLNLLKRLEPYVGKCYEEVASLPTLKKRFQAVSEIYKKKKNAQGARMSIANSQRLMEIMEVPTKEIIGNAMDCRQGPLEALEQLKMLGQDKEVQDSRLQALLRGPIAPANKLNQANEEVLIKQWFASKEPYDWIQLPYSQYLQEKHLNGLNFQNKGGLLTALDLRGAKNLGERGFMALHTYCPNLQYLNISEWPLSRLGHFKIGLLGPYLAENNEPIFPSLQRLIVEGCKNLREIRVHLPALESLEAGGSTNLVSFSLTAPSLRRLDVTGHQVKDEGFDLRTSSLEGLIFKGNSPYAAAIVQALQEQRGTKLTLSGKGLNAVDIVFLLNHPIFKRNFGKYEEIGLNYNQIGALGAVEFAKNLQGTNVHTVYLNSNQIGDVGAVEIAKNLQGTNVHTVYLNSNQIGDVGAVEFAKNLQGTSVHTVYLSNNHIGDSGAAEFAKNLQGTSVHTVNLFNNHIGDSGAAEFAKNLQGTSIHTVDLDHNQIGDVGAVKLAKNLQGTSVHTVNLSYNQIGDSGAAEFAKNLQGTSVHTVNLHNNYISDSGAAEFAKNLQGTSVHMVNLGGRLLLGGLLLGSLLWRGKIGVETQKLLRKQYPIIQWKF